jgi:hypothetical protein
MKRIIKNESGAALIIAITTLAIVTLLGAGALMLANGTLNQTVWDRSSNQAFQAAEAGFDQAMARIRNGQSTDDFTAQLKTGEAQVTITKINIFMYKVRSVGAQPSLAKPKARRAVEAVIMHLDPKDVFFADACQGTVIGSTTFDGPLYVRDRMEVSGNSALTGGPFFIKDDPATVGDTGDLYLDGSSSMGTAANPIYLFIDGALDDQGDLYTQEIFTDVPDLKMPIINADMMGAKRDEADLVIDSDPGVPPNGLTPLVFDKNTADATWGTYPTGPYLKWTKSTKTLEIDGQIFLDGNLAFGSNQVAKVTYAGRGTITANGNIAINSEFAPNPSSNWPDTDAFGLVTPYDIDVNGKTGNEVYGVLYAYGTITMKKQIQFYGNVTASTLDFDNNPHVHVATQLDDSNMPPGMPEIEAMTSISGWREVQP